MSENPYQTPQAPHVSISDPVTIPFPWLSTCFYIVPLVAFSLLFGAQSARRMIGAIIISLALIPVPHILAGVGAVLTIPKTRAAFLNRFRRGLRYSNILLGSAGLLFVAIAFIGWMLKK